MVFVKKYKWENTSLPVLLIDNSEIEDSAEATNFFPSQVKSSANSVLFSIENSLQTDNSSLVFASYYKECRD